MRSAETLPARPLTARLAALRPGSTRRRFAALEAELRDLTARMNGHDDAVAARADALKPPRRPLVLHHGGA